MFHRWNKVIQLRNNMRVSKWQNVDFKVNYSFNSCGACVYSLTWTSGFCVKFNLVQHYTTSHFCSGSKLLTLWFQLTHFQDLIKIMFLSATSSRFNNNNSTISVIQVLQYKNCSRFVVHISDRNILSFFGSVSFDRGSILGQKAQGQHSPSVTTTQSCKTGACGTGNMSLSPTGAKNAL